LSGGPGPTSAGVARILGLTLGLFCGSVDFHWCVGGCLRWRIAIGEVCWQVTGNFSEEHGHISLLRLVVNAKSVKSPKGQPLFSSFPLEEI